MVLVNGKNISQRKGTIYKLFRDDHKAGGKCYIGSTTIPYFSVRLCQHRKAWRGGKDYHGIFQEGSDPCVEILDTYDFMEGDKDSVVKVREREQYYFDLYEDTCINIRRPHPKMEDLSPQKRYQKKYDRSEKGQLCIRKAFIMRRLRRGEAKRQETITKYSQELVEIEDRLKVLRQQKKDKKIKKDSEKINSIISFCEEDTEESPQDLHQDQ